MIPFEFVPDAVIQRNFEQINKLLGVLAEIPITAGNGVPSHTPAGKELRLRWDGGVGSTFYVYDGTSWTAVA